MNFMPRPLTSLGIALYSCFYNLLAGVVESEKSETIRVPRFIEFLENFVKDSLPNWKGVLSAVFDP